MNELMIQSNVIFLGLITRFFPAWFWGIWYRSLVYHATHATPYQDVALQ